MTKERVSHGWNGFAQQPVEEGAMAAPRNGNGGNWKIASPFGRLRAFGFVRNDGIYFFAG